LATTAATSTTFSSSPCLQPVVAVTPAAYSLLTTQAVATAAVAITTVTMPATTAMVTATVTAATTPFCRCCVQPVAVATATATAPATTACSWCLKLVALATVTETTTCCYYYCLHLKLHCQVASAATPSHCVPRLLRLCMKKTSVTVFCPAPFLAVSLAPNHLQPPLSCLSVLHHHAYPLFGLEPSLDRQ
jgi:hypothetical protein